MPTASIMEAFDIGERCEFGFRLRSESTTLEQFMPEGREEAFTRCTPADVSDGAQSWSGPLAVKFLFTKSGGLGVESPGVVVRRSLAMRIAP